MSADLSPAADDGAIPRVTVSPGRDRTSRALVLIADDNEDTCESLAAVMRLAGYRVLLATNGADALRVARDSVPDLLLMDVSMPGLDGWTVTALLKGDPATQHIIIVMMSGVAVSALIPIERQPAWDGYLTKPFSPLRLQRELDERLGSRA